MTGYSQAVARATPPLFVRHYDVCIALSRESFTTAGTDSPSTHQFKGFHQTCLSTSMTKRQVLLSTLLRYTLILSVDTGDFIGRIPQAP